jgi:hypothetical protein
MSVGNENRATPGEATPPRSRDDNPFPLDETSPLNPAEAAPGSSALSDDASDDSVLTPGEYTYQSVEDRHPATTEREYERPGAEAGTVGRRDEMTGPDREPHGLAPARELPIPGYENLTIPEIVERIASLSTDKLREIQDYERAHRRRKTLLVRLERHLRNEGK